VSVSSSCPARGALGGEIDRARLTREQGFDGKSNALAPTPHCRHRRHHRAESFANGGFMRWPAVLSGMPIVYSALSRLIRTTRSPQKIAAIGYDQRDQPWTGQGHRFSRMRR
jgi:hypothetical protein